MLLSCCFSNHKRQKYEEYNSDSCRSKISRFDFGQNPGPLIWNRPLWFGPWIPDFPGRQYQMKYWLFRILSRWESKVWKISWRDFWWFGEEFVWNRRRNKRRISNWTSVQTWKIAQWNNWGLLHSRTPLRIQRTIFYNKIIFQTANRQLGKAGSKRGSVKEAKHFVLFQTKSRKQWHTYRVSDHYM